MGCLGQRMLIFSWVMTDPKLYGVQKWITYNHYGVMFIARTVFGYSGYRRHTIVNNTLSLISPWCWWSKININLQILMQHRCDVIESSFCKELEYTFSHSTIVLSIADYHISLIIPYYSLVCFCRCGMMHGSIHQMISHVWRYGLMERKAILMITLLNKKLNTWWGNIIQELKEIAVFSQISSWQLSL